MIERHQEPDRSGARIVTLGGGLCALTLHETGDLPVEIKFLAVDLEVNGVRDALREYLLGCPRAIGPPLGEVDHRFLCTAEVKRRAATVHSFSDGTHIGVGVLVQQLQEQREVDRVALMRCRGQHQEVVRCVP